ncbi:lipoprotein [Mesoplasma melaleucae]|uniref:Lipoprotein n=1 Tax=Mesoplasma melaleucae TaxID=81459 RepID=A0A2K8NVA9_9MOLU|nr:lipoprotein [Mesoplasma melaleucae]ATZ17694.1 hypothetical protein EMELA_v1c01090 [Mesoplasma melaleucae]
MKKLLSIITSLTVAASATTSLVSCKVITNLFKIEISNWEAAGDLKYKFDTKEGIYKPTPYDSSTTDDQKKANVKKALDGASGTFASSLVADMINSVFFNSELNVTKNTIKTWQYLFRTNQEGVYADGQFRTAGLNSSQEDEIKEYYSKVTNISSLLGLYQYTKYTSTESSTKADANLTKLSPETINEIETSGIFSSSNNQGITNVKINFTPSLYEGKIGLGNLTGDTEIKKYDSNYISPTTNYNAKTAKETEKDPSKGYKEYLAGTNIAYNFFQQLMILEVKSTDLELPITVKEVKEQSETSKKNVKKQGLILNPKSSEKATEPIVFEYTTNDKKEKTAYSYGYSLVSLAPIDLEITYNDNVDLKTGTPNGKNYLIDLTIDGLSAAFKPILNFTSNKDEEDKTTTSNGTPYIGWRFMGYQFNSKNIVGYNEDGTLFTEKRSKKMTATNKKFNDFNITKLEFKEA